MWTDEQLEIRALAREFAEGEIRPRSAAWDAEGRLDDDVFGALAELGFLGMRVPEEQGGLGLDASTWLLALEELAWGDAAVALSVMIHSGPVCRLVRTRGSARQRQRFLPGLATGELLGAFALAEPGAGSDAGALTTRAVRVGGGWSLSGTKTWVTNGDRADVVVVFARTSGEGSRADGVGAFLVDRESEGYRVEGRETTMGLRASETVTVLLEEVRVNEDRLLGSPDEGLGCARDALDAGRAGMAALSLGIAQAAFEHAREYAAQREQFGRVLAEFGAVREKLAEMATGIAQARVLTHRAAAMLGDRPRNGAASNPGPGPGTARAACAMAKLAASETAVRVADEAVQIFGGYGYMRDYPVEKLLRDAEGTEICLGTSEILRLVVAREVLGDEPDVPADPL